jgi:zinc/manganese transport system substrate-binding protein
MVGLVLALLALLTACGGQQAAAPAPTTAATAPAAATAAPAATLAAPAAATAPAATPASASAAPTAVPAPSANRLQVVATFSILGDMVKNVAGDNVDLAVLVGPGGDAHTFEPSPADSATLANANVLFEIGLDFETWLDDVYTASGSQATRVLVSEGVTTLKAEEEHGHSHEGEQKPTGAAGTATTEEHEHGEYDPHIWQSVDNAKLMVENIRDALIAADAANAETYRANATAYLAQLTELDTFIKAEVESLPAERRKLLTSHDAFGYLANSYGFEVLGSAMGSVSTEVADPSAADIAELVSDIKATGVPAIFAETAINPSVMETLSNETGVKLGPELFADALSEAGGPAPDYITLMRYNVSSIVTALKG